MSCNCIYCFPEKFLREKNVALLRARRNWEAEGGNRYSFTCNITSVPISLPSDGATLSMILSALSGASGRTPSPDMKPVLATLVCKQPSWANRGLSDSLKRVLCTKQWNYSACHAVTALSLVTAPTIGSNSNWKSPRFPPWQAGEQQAANPCHLIKWVHNTVVCTAPCSCVYIHSRPHPTNPQASLYLFREIMGEHKGWTCGARGNIWNQQGQNRES